METGEKIYVEHIMHKPQIGCFHFEGKDNKYKIYGSFEFKGTLNGANSLKGWREGKTFIEFHDGVKYNIGCPLMIINNIITG